MNESIRQTIIEIIKDTTNRGDAYITVSELLSLCRNQAKQLSNEQFFDAISKMESSGYIHIEENRVYPYYNLQYENRAARDIAYALRYNVIGSISISPDIKCGDITLDANQRKAVEIALTHRLSMVLGGAGSGKSTIIQAIAEHFSDELGDCRICAPTGKAAQNIRERTHIQATTIHRLVEAYPGANFLEGRSWDDVGLVIIDESSMVTLEMLAGILSHTSSCCHVVLLGDPEQLLSVGAGNVINDLVRLGTPVVRLSKPYRQKIAVSALYHNVSCFSEIKSFADIAFDDSFSFIETADNNISSTICNLMRDFVSNGYITQVLSPVNSNLDYSVSSLNSKLQLLMNPSYQTLKYTSKDGRCFKDGDRVMITQNDFEQNCFNGDIGTLKLYTDGSGQVVRYTVSIYPDRHAAWSVSNDFRPIQLAYALTVHKSQGSQYDVIIMPISNRLSTMLYRNLLYTAISRAGQRVILVGEKSALNMALTRRLPERKSMLVEKARALAV